MLAHILLIMALIPMIISDYYSDTNETGSSLTVDETGEFAGDIVSGMVLCL